MVEPTPLADLPCAVGSVSGSMIFICSVIEPLQRRLPALSSLEPALR
jgi:hypothetical protein